MEQPKELTLGMRRVRASFNPSSNADVDLIKSKVADLIDLCEDYRQRLHESPAKANEINRLMALAQTHFEDAAMWAVKAVTA